MEKELGVRKYSAVSSTPVTESCSLCQAEVTEYFYADGEHLCESCKERIFSAEEWFNLTEVYEEDFYWTTVEE